MGKDRPTLSQAEKKRLAEEKQAEKQTAMAAEREARKAQLQQRHLAHTPPWVTSAVAQLESLKERLQTDGEIDDEIIERCGYHAQMLGELSKALEKQRLTPDALADVKDYVVDFLLETPCGPEDIVERLTQGGDDGLYEIAPDVGNDEPTAAVLQVPEAPLPSAEKAKLSELRSAGGSGAAEQESGGRTIQTHSSYVPGLKDLCRRLEKLAEVKVVHPGAISTVDAHTEAFEMKLQRAGEGVASQKFKFAARTGRQVQDVTIVLKPGLALDDDAVRTLVDDAMQQPRTQAPSSYDDLPGEGRLNQTAAEMREQQNQQAQGKHKEKHDAKVKAEAEKKRAAIKEEKKKKFQASGASRQKGFDLDAAAEDWTAQEVGEKAKGRAWKLPK